MTLSIAILHYAGPPGIGGVEATIAAHARVMVTHGCRVRVLAGSAGPLGPGIDVISEPLLSSRGETIDSVNAALNAGVADQRFESLVSATADRLLQQLAGVDIAIVHNVLTLHKNLAFTAALYRLHSAGLLPRLLAWSHDFAWSDPLYAPDLYPDYPWKLLRYPWPHVRYVVVSADRRSMLADLLQIEPESIAVVPPGVDLPGLLKLERRSLELVQQLELLSADPLLLLPARITRRKNIEAALAIVAALRTEGFAPRLIISGPPGPHNPTNAAYLAILQRLRTELNLEDSVIFLYEQYVEPDGRPRPVDDIMLADLYRLADALLFPSRAEGFGMPIVEAGLLGLPIFCSDIAPFRETAGDSAVYFGLDQDPADSARRIAAVLRADPRYRLRRRVRGEYTWEAIYQRKIVPLLRDEG